MQGIGEKISWTMVKVGKGPHFCSKSHTQFSRLLYISSFPPYWAVDLLEFLTCHA